MQGEIENPGGRANDEMTLVGLLRRQAGVFGVRPFLRSFDGTCWSFEDLDRLSDRLARWLVEKGCQRGDRVACFSENRPEMLALLFAANKAGCVFTPLNPQLKGDFLERQLDNARPRLLFTEAEPLGALEATGLPDDLAGVVVWGDGAAESVAGKPVIAYPDSLPAAEPVPVDPVPSDISTIMYTSGTTGPAKGVLMPQAHCLLFGRGIAEALRLTSRDTYYVCLPLFHANGLFMQVIAALDAGSDVYLARRFSASGWARQIRESGATVTNILGVMSDFILAQKPAESDADNGLRCVMAVPVSASWLPEFETRFRVRVVQGFGMTECNMVTYSDIDERLSPVSSGRALDRYFEVRVADRDTDELLPPGAVGQIVVRPKVVSGFMAGYFRMPEKTVEAWRDLWFHTGDAAYMDESGRLFFVDRIKDCIRRRGENVSSYEVEQVIRAHPAIAECAVVGVRVEGAGGEEEIMVWAVAEAEVRSNLVEIREFCAQRLPKYAVPRFFRFVSELPKTATGKLRKASMRAHGVESAVDLLA